MLKRILALILISAMVIPFAACSKEEFSNRPALYDETVLTIDGKPFTYEYYRHYYLSAKESGIDASNEEVLEYILDKLLYDKAVDLILADNSLSLTDSEIQSIQSYITAFQSSMGNEFLNELSDRNMTIDVFMQSLMDMSEYNKLYEYFSKEENKKLDFSTEGVNVQLNKYNSGLHFIVNVDDTRTKDQAKRLVELVYSMLSIYDSISETIEIYDILALIEQTQATITELNNQIDAGTSDSETLKTLDTLVKKVGELKEQLTNKNDNEKIIAELSNYITKVNEYREIFKSSVSVSANSNDAELLEVINSEDLSKYSDFIRKSAKNAIQSKLDSGINNVLNSAANYGWVGEAYKNAAKAFISTPSYDTAKALMDVYAANKDMKEDTLLTNINKICSVYCIVESSLNFYEIFESLESIGGLFDIDATTAINASKVAACYQAVAVANDIIASLENGDATPGSISKEKLDAICALAYDFESLVVMYSDGYNNEAETQMFYYQDDSLLDVLIPVVSVLNEGEHTGIVEDKNAYHIFMKLEKDVEHFKENYYVYAALEEIIINRSKNIEYTLTDLYNSLNNEKIAELEKELGLQIGEIQERLDKEAAESNSDDGTLVWTVIIIVITVVVIVALGIAIANSSNVSSVNKNSAKKNGSSKKNNSKSNNIKKSNKK